MRIRDWSSDVCSSDLPHRLVRCRAAPDTMWIQHHNGIFHSETGVDGWSQIETVDPSFGFAVAVHPERPGTAWFVPAIKDEYRYPKDRSEEHTSELQSLMRISYAVFCLKKKTTIIPIARVRTSTHGTLNLS